MIRAYYNEHDPFAAEWLRMLILSGLIAEGDVDTRSIEDVTPSDIAGYTQCHFFAGIGGWSYALRLSGWPDGRPVWTCSCPCQPFSAAGKGDGFADERHLWPAAFHLISQRRPVTIFGEQVASPAGLAWLDTVSTDLERAAYSCGAVDICAAGIGAPHIRQRLYFRADSRYSRVRRTAESGETEGRGSFGETSGLREPSLRADSASSRHIRPLGKSENDSRDETRLRVSGNDREVSLRADSASGQPRNGDLQRSGEYGLLAEIDGIGYAGSPRLQEQFLDRRISAQTMGPSEREAFERGGYTRGFWANCDWWYGRDEKYRPIEPGLFPLAHGISGRMGKLRGYGNAIVPQLAAEFIQASEGL